MLIRCARASLACGKWRSLQTNAESNELVVPDYMRLSPAFRNEPPDYVTRFVASMAVHEGFLSDSDEASILEEIEPYMRRLRYEFDHWDDAIHGYRETERLKWNDSNTRILDRVRSLAFPPGVGQLKHVHVLDLDKKGYIKPHIDAVRFCGDTIAGLSLLTDSVMRLVHSTRKDLRADVLLRRRSLYVMKAVARYDYTHEILGGDASRFDDVAVPKDRRVSVICRNEPDAKDKEP